MIIDLHTAIKISTALVLWLATDGLHNLLLNASRRYIYRHWSCYIIACTRTLMGFAIIMNNNIYSIYLLCGSVHTTCWKLYIPFVISIFNAQHWRWFARAQHHNQCLSRHMRKIILEKPKETNSILFGFSLLHFTHCCLVFDVWILYPLCSESQRMNRIDANWMLKKQNTLLHFGTWHNNNKQTHIIYFTYSYQPAAYRARFNVKSNNCLFPWRWREKCESARAHKFCTDANVNK